MRRGRALVVVLPLVLAGCPDRIAYLGGDCGDLVGMAGDPETGPRACPGEDNGCFGGECVGVPGGWSGPTWLWFGPKKEAPACDGDGYYEGNADFVSAGICEVCTCQPPTGSCELPSQITMSTKACNIPGGQSSSFDAPPEWGGQCDGSTQVPPGVAHSLTVAPIEMTENGCVPGPPIPAKVIPAKGTTFARACHGQGWSICGDALNSACIPDSAPQPAGFALCIFQKGDNDCPTNLSPSFTEKHMFYDRADEECSDCGCGPPEGSVCKVMLSVYEDGMCSGPLVDQISVSSAAPVCVDVAPPGQALGSKSAGPPTYLPGMCAPMGGQASGVITGLNPATLCCRP